MSKHVVLSEHRAQLADRGIDIEAEGGEVFHLDPPELWPDAVFEASDPVDQVKKLWGDERYAAFVAAGGTARMLVSIIEGGWDATVPE